MKTSAIRVGYDISVSIFARSGIARYSRELLHQMQSRPDVAPFLLGNVRQADEVTRYYGGQLPGFVSLTLTHERALGAPLRRLTRKWIAYQMRRRFDEVDVVHYLGPQKIFADHPRAVSTIHDLIPMYDEYSVDAALRYRFPRMIKKQLRHSSAVVCPSEWVAGTVRERFPWFTGPITVTPLAAGPQFRPTPMDQELRRTLGLHKQYILFVGRIDVGRNNLDKMIQAWISLPESRRKDMEFLIVTDRNDKVVRTFLSSLKHTTVDSSVRIFNTIKNQELIQLLSNASALMFASQSEGFGLPILEAMQCGCPVVTSATTSMTEVGGESVIYVNPNDTEQIRHAILQVQSDETLLRDLRERGLQHCTKFSWERTAERTLEAYQTCPTR